MRLDTLLDRAREAGTVTEDGNRLLVRVPRRPPLIRCDDGTWIRSDVRLDLAQAIRTNRRAAEILGLN